MLIVLSVNEAKDVRMRDAHHSHVCTTTHTTLLYDISYLIDDVHEQHWTRRHTSCRAHHRTVWAKEFISHARAAAGLVNRCCGFRMIHDSSQRIWNLQNKACGKLAVCLAGVD